MTRTVLVTGGSGYYGTVVADLFQARGDRVRIFDLEAPTDPTDAEVVLGDVRDRNALRAACDGVDVIMNNVAQVPLAKDHELFWTVNVVGTANVLLAARDAGVDKVVHTSSSAIFGIPEQNPVDESTPGRPLEAYGQAKFLQAWLEDRDVSYVMAIRCSDTLTMPEGERRADELIAALPAQAWQTISAGAGAHGPREYGWARIPVRAGWKRGRGHWLLARRSLADPEEIAYYACYGPRRSSTADLAWVAGSRWHIEECFQQAKNEAGLDHYQVRSWRAWYAHITLSMLALAWLAASRAQAQKRGPAPATRA